MKKNKKQNDFNLKEELSNVNRYLKQGFTEYIKNKKVTDKKQFDKLYNEFKRLR